MINNYYNQPNPTKVSEKFIKENQDYQEIAKLPPFLRALLMTDGTVTKILEAFFWEPVLVQTLQQSFIQTEQEIPWLNFPKGEQILTRKVNLTGAQTKTIYASAFSLICTHCIPESFRLRLINGEIGIGVLIRDSGLESYREVLEINTDCSEVINHQNTVCRTYRILISGHPIILITEAFPLEVYWQKI